MERTLIPLDQLLIDRRADNHRVSVGVDVPIIVWSMFRTDVRKLAGRISMFDGQRWLIANDNPYVLAVGLFATLHAGRQAVLPANLQLGHLAELAMSVDGVITDLPLTTENTNILSPFDVVSDTVMFELLPLDLRAAAVILHTSGTTGSAVEIIKPLVCLDAEIQALEKTFGGFVQDSSSGLVSGTVPAYHIYGLLFRILWPLAAGRPLAQELISYPEELILASNSNQISILVSSPAFLKRARDVLSDEYLQSCGYVVFSSGGAMPTEIAASYNAVLEQPIIEVYGSTETGGIGYRWQIDAKIPSRWNPLPDIQLAIDHERLVLSVRSKFLPTSDWMMTGDLAEIDEDGKFMITGRIDRVVKLEEIRISLLAIESKIATRPEVHSVQVVSLKAQNSERQFLGAVVVPTDVGWDRIYSTGKSALVDDLRSVLKPYFSGVALPRKWRFIIKMPENERAKISVASIQALFDADIGRVTTPRILEQSISLCSATLRLQLLPEISYFEGHFDEEPILPGVVQVDWAIEFALKFFPIHGAFRRIEALKFFKVQFAGQMSSLELQYEPDRERLYFQYFDGEAKFSAGRVVFEGEV